MHRWLLGTDKAAILSVSGEEVGTLRTMMPICRLLLQPMPGASPCLQEQMWMIGSEITSLRA